MDENFEGNWMFEMDEEKEQEKHPLGEVHRPRPRPQLTEEQKQRKYDRVKAINSTEQYADMVEHDELPKYTAYECWGCDNSKGYGIYPYCGDCQHRDSEMEAERRAREQAKTRASFGIGGGVRHCAYASACTSCGTQVVIGGTCRTYMCPNNPHSRHTFRSMPRPGKFD